MNVSLLVSLASTEVDAKCYDAFNCGRQKDALTLLKQVRDPHSVKNENNFTILHCAAYHGWLDVVKELIIEYQFDPDCKDNDGYTPFRTASNSEKQDVVEYLETVIGAFVVHLLFISIYLFIIVLVYSVVCRLDPNFLSSICVVYFAVNDHSIRGYYVFQDNWPYH